MKKVAHLALAALFLGAACAVPVTPAVAGDPHDPWSNNHPLSGNERSYDYYRGGDRADNRRYYRDGYRYPYRTHYGRNYGYPEYYGYYDDGPYYRHRYHRRYRHYGPENAAAALFGAIAGTIARELRD